MMQGILGSMWNHARVSMSGHRGFAVTHVSGRKTKVARHKIVQYLVTRKNIYVTSNLGKEIVQVGPDGLTRRRQGTM